jgi:hypothetical protein
MDNPYDSAPASTSHHNAEFGPTTSDIPNHAAYGCLVIVASVICWVAFVFAVASAAVFNEPTPPETYVWLGAAVLAGLAAETLGAAYIFRPPVKPMGAFLVILLAMAGNTLPISISAIAIVSDLILARSPDVTSAAGRASPIDGRPSVSERRSDGSWQSGEELGNWIS